MDAVYLCAKGAAARLGITVTTLYDWLGRSDRGLLVLRGRPTTIDYFQSGPSGQGKIQIAACEVERVRGLMRVSPSGGQPRRPAPRRTVFPGISVPLGRPRPDS